MNSCRRILWLAAGLVVIASVTSGRASAQSPTARNTTINATGAGYLGILQMKCDCTLRLDAEDRFRTFMFRTDPVVTSIESGSPADGALRPGDYITHIDGERLQSTEGSQRFADIRPGQAVELTIRRDGVTSKVRMKAGDRRRSGMPRARAQAPPAAQAPPGVPAAPAVSPATPAPSTPPADLVPGVWAVVPDSRATPSGWFGFSFRCNDCGWARGGGSAGPVWESDEAPELSMISAGGPAARAGLRRGDRLTHIDGYSITSREGSRRLGSVRPGQKVKLTVMRDGTPLTRELTLGRRPEARAAAAVVAAQSPAPPVAAAMRELRYTGKIDDVSVEVWSTAGSSVTRVGDTMVITVGGTVVRLKADPAK